MSKLSSLKRAQFSVIAYTDFVIQLSFIFPFVALCVTVFFKYDQVTNAGLKAKKSFLKGAQMTTKYIRKTVIVDDDQLP